MLEQLYLKALMSYIEMLEIHIDTKTGPEPFHRKTAEFYELLFDVAHELAERHVDLGWQIRKDTGDCMAQMNRAVAILTELKAELELAEWMSKGTENLIYAQLDKLEFAIWSATWFIKGNKPIMKEYKEEPVKEEVKTPKEEAKETETTWVVETVIEL